ncbi:DNA/RNA non-specific endonuclease [Rhodoferax sp. U11-2br]|uniref:DNA/RNA non-specific endonuclease n=1 Tax=Rhodoferax sp. U11-2br TaxID=2838878 RepID=UPI001BEAE31C|nr:DNA/RNA non-specific endonuclease [Rhodoferax sp. U11-2br]MBT3067950.1 DNA/RNA non-specific endonuclease [Rhodoferax sp. U11-2br]
MENKLCKITLYLSVALSSTAFTQSSAESLAREPISLYQPAQRSSDFDGCKDVFPGGVPIALNSVSEKWKPRGLCSNNFAVLHSGLSRTPLVVVERLYGTLLKGASGLKRTNVFFEDPRLPKAERAALSDFEGSGLDRGHLAAAADQTDEIAMAQSFALSNIVAQNAVNNREIWSKLEADTRKYALRAKGPVFVYSGPLFKEGLKTIGAGVWVPTHLFKLVHDPQADKTWVHLLPNDSTPYRGPPLSYADFVKDWGWDVLNKQR